jgi:hypothetical protein
MSPTTKNSSHAALRHGTFAGGETEPPRRTLSTPM